MRRRQKIDRLVVIPIECESDMEKFYLEEAKSTKFDSLPELFYHLLRDRLEAISGKNSKLWFPRGIVQFQVQPAVENINSDGIKTAPSTALQVLGSEDE